jgi:hypothetical protein
VSSAYTDAGTSSARVRDLLADSLALWQVDGVVTAPDLPAAVAGCGGATSGPAIAVIVTTDGTRVLIERASDERAFRWLVRLESPGEPPRAAQARPCASLVGMLNAVRHGLGVDIGEPLRIVATSPTQ